ncbi:hypothetical protein F3Y22_tig00007179pilonHSYRG00082 [Hibiscus syriacus]|uniref:Uncharacterized protein n=1 Tax=Hibiscus syriacus TaxID=106335 RepID=A0A6A3CBY5_HIBSY|nr:hypothetical protein F3Y22_tig00007179pilonHSYRG00082 [Hibiscus syriacus]
MSERGVQVFDDRKGGIFSICDLGSQWSLQQNDFHYGSLFASVGQMGIGFGPNSPNQPNDGGIKAPFIDLFLKNLPSQDEIRVVGVPEGEAASKKTKKKVGLKLKIKVSNPFLEEVNERCCCRGGIEDSRRAIGDYKDAFDGGEGNLVNVIRVAPSKAIEVPAELYRGLAPSLIGVILYAATNYFAYDTLRKVYRRVSKEKIGNIETLFIGSLAGAISSSATFPLEEARRTCRSGLSMEDSCMKLVPAAGISFMCYEACKRILVDKDEEA